MNKTRRKYKNGCSSSIPASGKKPKDKRGLSCGWMNWDCAPNIPPGKAMRPKGKTPLLKKSGNRFYLTMLTATSPLGHLIFMVEECNFNMAVYLRFLKKLLRSVKQKVFLITDKHPVHLGKSIGEWLWTKCKRIEVFYLPNYSPELNPVEYFNQDIKTNAAGNRRAKDREELKKAVETFAKQKKKNPHQVRKYFFAPAVKYAAKPN